MDREWAGARKAPTERQAGSNDDHVSYQIERQCIFILFLI